MFGRKQNCATTLKHRTNRMSAIAALIAASGIGLPASAQPVLTVTDADIDILTNGLADDWIVPGVDVSACAEGPVPIPGLNGFDFGQKCNEEAQELNHNPASIVETITKTRVFVDGDGTQCITVYWNSGVLARSGARDGFFGVGDSTLDALIEFTPSGVPDGTALEITYRYDVWGFAMSRLDFCPAGGFPEELVDPVFGPPDYVDWQNSLQLDGVQLLDPIRFNTFLPSGPFVSNYQTVSQTVTGVNATGGVPITLEIDSFIESQISFWGRGVHCGDDSSDGSIWGSITICVNNPGQPAPNIPAAPGSQGTLPVGAIPVFSIDIASANCLSDPTGAGIGLFDAGDAYEWFGPAVPAGGQDGVVNDALPLGSDHVPVPGAPAPLPFCSGLLPGDPALAGIFNMDAIDRLSLDVQGLLNQHAGGLPIFVDPTDPAIAQCLNRSANLFISMDDDALSTYLGDPMTGVCDMPISSESKQGETYGSDIHQDEVIGLVTDRSIAGSRANLLARYPVLTEERLHTSLGPNPVAPDQSQDNDVNGIDIATSSACDITYFSADHAATGVDASGNVLRSGVVYQHTPGGGLVEAVDPTVHLGLGPDTDIDAIEFVVAEFGFAPASTAIEGETCQIPIPTTDFFNGGCNSPSPVFTELALNQTMAATTGDDAQTRDTDWFRVVAPVPGDYTLTVIASGDVVAGFIGDANGPTVNPVCGVPAQINPVTTGTGQFTMTAQLATPGEYWIFVSTDGWNNQGCFDYSVLLEPPQAQTGSALALLYSVDDDDPATLGIDESGGLDSGQIYISFLNGVSEALLSAALDDNIDGLTSWSHPLAYASSTSLGPQCPGDVTGDNIVDLADLNAVLGNFGQGGPAGDANGDGVVDLMDLNLVLGNFGTVCP